MGTTKYKFARLINKGISLARQYPKIKFVIQSGTYIPPKNVSVNVVCKQYFSFPEIQDFLKRARLVICHAGIGTILQTNLYEKKPLVIPRVFKYGEHANDHESAIAKFLYKKNLIFLETDVNKLEDYLNIKIESIKKLKETQFKKKLIANLRKYCNQSV